MKGTEYLAHEHVVELEFGEIGIGFISAIDDEYHSLHLILQHNMRVCYRSKWSKPV